MSVFTDLRYTIKVQSHGNTDTYVIDDWSQNHVCVAKAQFLDIKIWGKKSKLAIDFVKKLEVPAAISTGTYPAYSHSKAMKSVMTTKISFETLDGKKLLELSKEKTWSRIKLKFEMKDPNGNVLGLIIAKNAIFFDLGIILQDLVGNEQAKIKGGFFIRKIFQVEGPTEVYGKINVKPMSPEYHLEVDIFDKTLDPLFIMALAVVFDITHIE